MADPLSTASGLLTLVVFAFQSSQVLYQAVASFQSNQRNIRDLREELEALSGVLQSLQETATDADDNLTTLKLPLLRCGKACQDFEAMIVKCTEHSGGSRSSFRDWAKLRYMGEDINGFKNMLAGYKSTIAIALGDANIRTSAVTSKVLREYKELITNTTADLEEHLQKIDNKIQTLSLRGISISDEDAAEREQILEERDSTQQCLGICAQVFTHIDQVQPTIFETIPLPAGTSKDYAPKPTTFPSARLVTIDGFKACKATLSDTTTQLESHLRDIDERLQKLSSSPSKKSNKQSVEQETIREELESIKQCLAICAQASTQANQERTNVFEDIAMADDGHQVLVSTIGDLVSARRVTAGARSLQFLGQMSDDSLQQLSRQRSHVATERVGESEGTGSKFKGLYGAGFKLSSKSLTDLGTTIK